MSPHTLFKLNTGNFIPAVGLGTWQSQPGKVELAVTEALKCGYRHIDGAFAYGNEKEVGAAIKESGIPREDIFVTTKLWVQYSRPENVQKGFEASLNNLGLDYIDLYLMHWPVALNPNEHATIPRKPDGTRDIDDSITFVDTYKAMEKLLLTGKVRAIGVSNFSIHDLEVLISQTSVVPAVNQVELHPFLSQPKLVNYCHSKGIHVSAYSPLGSTDSPLHTDPVLTSIAKKYNHSVPQVLISWAVQRGTSVLPKSVTPERIRSNFETIVLSEEDLEKINGLDKGKAGRLIRPDWGRKVFDEDFE